MLTLYNFIISLAVCVLYPYGRIKAAMGDSFWSDRLGLTKPEAKNAVWLHAASVGEARVVSYLIDQLLKKEQSLQILVTTVTRTGQQTARELFGDKAEILFFPYDASFVMHRFLANLQPRLIGCAETEIWPNLVRQSSKANIPIILFNGRMSERAFGKYQKIRRSMASLLSKYDHFFFRTDSDAERYLALAGSENLPHTICGDMKFDAPMTKMTAGSILATRERLNVMPEDFLFVAGSTRPGEEAAIAALYQNLAIAHPNLRIAIAPRHIERSDEVANIFAIHGITVCREKRNGNGAKVILIDRMGELNELYAAADLAFVGGTLAEIGGHNILEPVWCGTPVLFGQSLDNVKEAADYIVRNNFGGKVADAEELTRVVGEVIDSKVRFDKRDDSDRTDSATATVAEYIIRRVGHA